MSLSVGRNKSKTVVCVADFETTTKADDCRVWGWGLVEVGESPQLEDVEMGTSIHEFMENISMYNATIYFHNLRFDGTFILDWLFSNNYRHTISYARKGQFETLISKDNKFYTITVKWKSGYRTEFRDSLKKIPMSVNRAADAYKLPISKLHIDYDEDRPVGHELTDDEREYIANDVCIIAAILHQQLDEGMKRLTVGADSLGEYRTLTGNKSFERQFPVLTHDMDSQIRLSYRGGWTYPDPRLLKQIVGPGAVYDVNSLYPSVMYYELLPWGMPIWFSGAPEPTEQLPLYVVSITFLAKIKPNHVACIQVKNHSIFVQTEYQTEISEPTTLVVTNVDLELWQEHYDLEILSYNGGWYFRGAHNMFEDYIDKWSEVKANAKGGKREIAKLHLNSLYGKFATNPDVTGRIPVYESGKVALAMGDTQLRNPIYTAVGAFITAYARRVTIRAAQENYDDFLYADTDSLHLNTLNPPKGVEIHESKLGAWKKEYEFDYAVFWRAKSYCERRPDKTDDMGNTYYETHIAGLPLTVAGTLRLGDFKDGAIFSGKLLPKTVSGGMILVDTEFKLKS